MGEPDRAASFAEQIPRRLDKLLKDATRLPRAELRRAIEGGRVRARVQNLDVEPAADRLMFGDDEVRLDGALLRQLEEHQTLIFNKPKNVTTTVRDPEGRRDLSRYLAAMPLGCFPVGRLDRETTGAILFTTDGDLANAVLQPEHHARKHYELRVAGVVRDEDPRLALFRRGIASTRGRLVADEIRVLSTGEDETTLMATLSMGKNRQLRRMCYATGLRLRHLHRCAIGPLDVEGLSTGEWRLLSESEVERLWAAVQGRSSVRQQKLAALRGQAAAARAEGEPLTRLERWLRLQEDGTAVGLLDDPSPQSYR